MQFKQRKKNLVAEHKSSFNFDKQPTSIIGLKLHSFPFNTKKKKADFIYTNVTVC
jgi:hypothetical protein